MADLERILTGFEMALQKVADELATGAGAAPEDRDHIQILHTVLDGVVRAYGGFHLARAASLDSSTSVMYAHAAQDAPRVLNVPLRSLVEFNSVTEWQARFLHGSLNSRRTVLVSGEPGTGKSTLLNALVQQIPVDQRIVALEAEAELPVLNNRAFSVRLFARPGTAAAANAMKKAATMKPGWLLVGRLVGKDGAAFFETLSGGISGLATFDSPEPEVTLTDWASTGSGTGEHLQRLTPLVVHLERDSGGRPRVARINEVRVRDGSVRLQEQKPK